MDKYDESSSSFDFSQIVGYTLGDALDLVKENGYELEKISITSPPKNEITEYDNSFRVLRVNNAGNKSLAVLICKPL